MADREVNPARAFWQAVTACLERFHAMTPAAAERTVHELRLRLRLVDSVSGDEVNPIYHAEPWHVAADIAHDNKRTLSKTEEKTYRAILRKTGLLGEPAEPVAASHRRSAAG